MSKKTYFIISFRKYDEEFYFFSANVNVRTFETAKRFASFKSALDCIYKYGLSECEPKVMEVTERKI